MFRLDDSFLVRLGLGDMPAEDKGAFLMYVGEELEARVGAELSRDLSDEQLEEFERLANGDQDDATKWMEEHCPGYKDVVKKQMRTLEEEIIAGKDVLLNPEG